MSERNFFSLFLAQVKIVLKFHMLAHFHCAIYRSVNIYEIGWNLFSSFCTRCSIELIYSLLRLDLDFVRRVKRHAHTCVAIVSKSLINMLIKIESRCSVHGSLTKIVCLGTISCLMEINSSHGE